jgi:hypothetical protein
MERRQKKALLSSSQLEPEDTAGFAVHTPNLVVLYEYPSTLAVYIILRAFVVIRLVSAVGCLERVERRCLCLSFPSTRQIHEVIVCAV